MAVYMAEPPTTSKSCVYNVYDSKEDENRKNVGYNMKEQIIKHLIKS